MKGEYRTIKYVLRERERDHIHITFIISYCCYSLRVSNFTLGMYVLRENTVYEVSVLSAVSLGMPCPHIRG